MPKNIVVIGCGYWGKNLVRNMHQLGALAAVVDETEAGRNRAKEIAPHTPVYDTIEPVLQNPAIQGVVIAAPAELHARLTAEALQAGKDVFCEKPLALRLDDGRRLAAERLNQSVPVNLGSAFEISIKDLLDNDCETDRL